MNYIFIDVVRDFFTVGHLLYGFSRNIMACL